jgi:hypothetical protein
MPANVKKMNINNSAVTITLLDGTIEKYDLNNETEKAAYIKKYGKLPAPPPPPPLPAYPTAEKYKEAALKYEKHLKLSKLANSDRLSATLLKLKTLDNLKAGTLTRLTYLKAQTMQLDAQNKYLVSTKQKYLLNTQQTYLKSALKRLEFQNIYLLKQKSLLKVNQLQLKGKPILKKTVTEKSGTDSEKQ